VRLSVTNCRLGNADVVVLALVLVDVAGLSAVRFLVDSVFTVVLTVTKFGSSKALQVLGLGRNAV